MKKLIFFSISFVSIFVPIFVSAQGTTSPAQELDPSSAPVENFIHGRVKEVLLDEQKNIAGTQVPFQRLNIELLDGADAGKTVEIENLGTSLADGQRFKSGQRILVTKIESFGNVEYHIVDVYRLPGLIWAGVVFLTIVFLFARLKGLTALAGLAAGIVILAIYVVPKIIAGANPLVTSLVGALFIAFLSLYLAHGFNSRTTIALISTIATLLLAAGIAWIFVKFAYLRGLGSEEAFFLQVDPRLAINLKGLLLGGILIGTLGVLDDITTAQATIVSELKKANQALSGSELYSRGLAVGREHIVSLVNTLALAYVGASFPLFLLFALDNPQPLWVTFNHEFIAEEIVRTLAGSVALVLAVPITTALAAWYFGKRSNLKRQT